MNIILILYPKAFNCYPKFLRKTEKIISSMKFVTIAYANDYNGFIKKLCSESSVITQSVLLPDWSPENITHAIIFDDGEEFPTESNLIMLHELPLRLIKIPITRVINLKVASEFKSKKNTVKYEYIGRGSYWGNPYSMYEDGDDREEVIRKFKYDFDYEKFPNKDKSEVFKLAGKRLGCFCKPKVCHGDVIADFLNSWDDGE